MKTMKRFVGLSSAFALVISPALALAHGGATHAAVPDHATHDHAQAATRPAAQGPSYAVNERFVRDVGNNCQYIAKVNGTVRQAQPNGTMWEPDLAVDSNVRCPQSSGEHLTMRTLAGDQLAATDLTRALTERASVVALHGDRLCTYTPTFAFANGQLTTESVSQSCQRLGVGGGPLW